MDRQEGLIEHRGRTRPAVRRATGLVLAMLDSVVRSRVRIHGARGLPDGPILFVSNHFTRSETFLLPWVLDRIADRTVSSLAWHGLFRGVFGTFLESVGARSTHEPGIKERIVRELAEGVCDWLIYPEGEMVKNKRIWSHGRLQLQTLEQNGPAHTGAALIALNAIRARRESGLTPPVSVVPVSVTYHPIRPGPNPLLRLASILAGPLPGRVEEELLVEGKILFERTDIDVVMGRPIDIDAWIPHEGDGHRISPARLGRLTTRFMQSVYSMTVRNLDHLVATSISSMTQDAITQEDLARAMFLASRETAAAEDGLWHPGVGPALLDAMSGVRSPSLEDVMDLAVRENVCANVHGVVVRHRDGFRPHSYDEMRLHHGISVLANEIASDRVLVRSLEKWVSAAPAILRARSVGMLERFDLEEHVRDGGDPSQSPRWVVPAEPRGVAVLAHGYLATPEEMHPLAESLARYGWATWLVRLPGHAARAESLDRVHRQDWWRGFQRGLAIARGRYPGFPLVVGGFSTGSFLALRAAAELQRPPTAVVSIAAPFRLVDRRSLFAGVLDDWNRLVHGVGWDAIALDAISNESEFPGANYKRNSVHALRQMMRLADETRSLLPNIRCPLLAVQADHDPVVRAESIDFLFDHVGSTSRTRLDWPETRHGIVRGKGSEALHERIAAWLGRLTG